VATAPLLNLGASLLTANGERPAFCTVAPAVRLWRALNFAPAEPLGLGRRRLVERDGLRAPVWEFDNVDVGAAREAGNQYHFFLTVDGEPVASNFWTHGGQTPPSYPLALAPLKTAWPASAIDARIQVVWPHDGSGNPAPVRDARYVNLAADLFAHGTLDALPPDLEPTVRLYRALNSGPVEAVAVGRKILVRSGDLTFPRWQFENVDVSASPDPASTYYFRVAADDLPTYSNVWAHSAGASMPAREPSKLRQGC
jgi:hypothetical protein